MREEMRRVLATFAWTAVWWDEKATYGMGDGAEAEGHRAFAYEHADLHRQLGVRFDAQWKDVLEAANVFLSRATVLDGN